MLTIPTVYRVVSEAALPPNSTFNSTFECGCVYERERERERERVNERDKECSLFGPHTELYPKPLYLQIAPLTVPINVVVCMRERERE